MHMSYPLHAAHFGLGFPDADLAECVHLAALGYEPPAAFSWDFEHVRRLLTAPGGPNHHRSKPDAQELPFHLKVGRFYLVNPGEDDDAPFWIAQIFSIGAHIYYCFSVV
jgi:hypothetical protein